MTDEQHKTLIDYIIKVFKPGDRYVEILDKRTLTFEEAFSLMDEYAKDNDRQSK